MWKMMCIVMCVFEKAGSWERATYKQTAAASTFNTERGSLRVLRRSSASAAHCVQSPGCDSLLQLLASYKKNSKISKRLPHQAKAPHLSPYTRVYKARYIRRAPCSNPFPRRALAVQKFLLWTQSLGVKICKWPVSTETCSCKTVII